MPLDRGDTRKANDGYIRADRNIFIRDHVGFVHYGYFCQHYMQRGLTMWDTNSYDNRGFLDLDARHAFDEYMESALDNGGRWDCLDENNLFDAIGEYDERPFKADLALFASAYRKGDYKTCADIFYVISENYCRAMARHEFNHPDEI